MTIPNTIAAGKSSKVFSSLAETDPNLSAPESDKLNGLPVDKDYNIDKVKVATDVAVNTLQSMLNVQNVFGFEISYENKAPPIGAPNATATPQDPPHAII